MTAKFSNANTKLLLDNAPSGDGDGGFDDGYLSMMRLNAPEVANGRFGVAKPTWDTGPRIRPSLSR